MLTYIALTLTCLVSGTLTYYINHYTDRGPVFASGVVTLAAGILLPRLWPETGYILALSATCASYAGMAARSRITTIGEMCVCSVLVAALFALTQDVFVGIGGKLGTIAGIAVISTWGVRRAFLQRRAHERPES